MIRLNFKEPTTKAWIRWVRDCTKATATLKSIYKSGKAVEISDLYRRKSIKESVYLAKDGPFQGRCAYCESYISDFQHGDIDHFRPKKGVTDENGNPVTVQGAVHPGYYWLAYNWRNLLPSCITCNQPGEEGIGKHARFPVEGGIYALSEEELASERPLLLNPLDPNDDNPEDHLDINLNDGVMRFKEGSKRGDACIKIFGLNKRDQLVNERRAAIQEVKAKYAEIIFADAERAQELSQEIEAMEKGSLSYTLARRAQSREIKQRIVASFAR